MGILFEREIRFLARPLGAAPRALLVLAALLCAAAAALAADSWLAARAVPLILGAFGLLLLRAAVHGRVSSLLDVTVLGLYLGLWAAWSLPRSAVSFSPALSAIAGAGISLFVAVVFAWRRGRAEGANDLRTAAC